jgi:hypothetical protein
MGVIGRQHRRTIQKELTVARERQSKKPTRSSSSGPEDVERFLASLDHPRKREILAVRQVVLGADPSITEGIKWNAPSFRTSEYFATFHLRAKDGVQLILHLGAKKRDASVPRTAIPDPGSLLEWLGKDRASASFDGLEAIDAHRLALADIIRHWIKYV